ncbi:MAG: hypothetical protein CL920_02110 [Deltaproteobacteria bacterium]|nr:hypothetical protein [Deltaproteobacteria bacterium]|tara:strand:+ start:220 stop:1101 length:882 start_codon:yes stop_codon:yes gene_type:complete
MIQTIITHPGGAHKDDVLAVSVLIAKYSAPVFRREPTEQELADPTIAIVDIGNEHEPQKANFDHHHFPREHPPTCSLSLVLQHLGLYEDALQFCEWLEPAEWLDSRGPNKTADWLGVPRKAISQLNSPIDVTLLRRFAKKTTLEAGDPLYEFMRFVGQDLLDYLHLVRERIEFAKQHVEHWSIPCGDETIEALHMPRTEPETEEPRAALQQYIRAEGLDSTAAIVYPNQRGPGYGIARVDDHPQLDFSQLDGQEDLIFAHKSGFLCKTSATEPARLRELIIGAWKPKKGPSST